MNLFQFFIEEQEKCLFWAWGSLSPHQRRQVSFKVRINFQSWIQFWSSVLVSTISLGYMVIWNFIFALLSLPVTAQSQFPSTENCSFYQTLESQHQCGPKGYLQAAFPLCQKYLNAQPRMNDEIQAFFPQVRYCLQDEFYQLGSRLKCEKLDRIAIQTHIDCYLKTGFCELSWLSKTQLTVLTLPQMKSSLWRETAEQILKACQLQDRPN